MESTGTQYIDTGVKALSNVETIARGQFVAAGYYIALIGARNNNEVVNGRYIAFGMADTSSRSLRVCYDGVEKLSRFSIFDVNDVDFNNADREITINATERYSVASASFYYNNPSNIYLFALSGYNAGTGGYYGIGRLFFVKLQNYTTQEVLRNFIPCYRKSDNKPGMYDTVTKQFYTNSGSGEFILGPNA